MSRIIIGNQSFSTLVAASSYEQAKGLMNREWPPPIMAFPYKKAEHKKFWMKNTPSPLDIVFCSNGTVIGIYKGEPHSTMLIGPDVASDLVIEFPFGTVKNCGLRVGDSVRMCYSAGDAAKILKNS